MMDIKQVHLHLKETYVGSRSINRKRYYVGQNLLAYFYEKVIRQRTTKELYLHSVIVLADFSYIGNVEHLDLEFES